MPMENFFKVRAEKQNHIINAAFTIFGRQGYRKASLGDIAQMAGITKGMITYYFGSKKTLYLYLMECGKLQIFDSVMSQISENTNFFDRLRITMDIQIAAIKEHPSVLSFLNSVYKETDPEVIEEIKRMTASEEQKYAFLSEGINLLQFKPEVDPQLICNFILLAAGGFAEEIYAGCYSEAKLDEVTNNFLNALNLMQETFTK